MFPGLCKSDPLRSPRSTFRRYLSHCCLLTSILCVSSRHRRAIESFPIQLLFPAFIPAHCPVSLITLQPCARRKALVAGKASCSSSICNALGSHYHPMLSFLRRRMHCFTRVSPTNERLFWSAKSKAESEPTSRSIRTLEASADRRANAIETFSISSFGDQVHAR